MAVTSIPHMEGLRHFLKVKIAVLFGGFCNSNIY